MISRSITTTVDVDVGIDELLDELSKEDLLTLCFGQTDDGSSVNEQMIDRAYLALRSANNIPEPIRQLVLACAGRIA